MIQDFSITQEQDEKPELRRHQPSLPVRWQGIYAEINDHVTSSPKAYQKRIFLQKYSISTSPIIEAK